MSCKLTTKSVKYHLMVCSCLLLSRCFNLRICSDGFKWPCKGTCDGVHQLPWHLSMQASHPGWRLSSSSACMTSAADERGIVGFGALLHTQVHTCACSTAERSLNKAKGCQNHMQHIVTCHHNSAGRHCIVCLEEESLVIPMSPLTKCSCLRSTSAQV